MLDIARKRQQIRRLCMREKWSAQIKSYEMIEIIDYY